MDLPFTRDLTVFDGHETQPAKLTIGKIEKAEGKPEDDWSVCYGSFGVLHPEVGKIYGIDPINALTNCIDFLRDLIKGHEKIGWKIYWIEEGDAGGL